MIESIYGLSRSLENYRGSFFEFENFGRSPFSKLEEFCSSLRFRINAYFAYFRHDCYIQNFRGILDYLIVEYHAIMKSMNDNLKSIGKLSSKSKHILDMSQDDATSICKMTGIDDSELLVNEIRLVALINFAHFQ